MRSVNRYATAFAALAATANAVGSLKDIKHIILFMQENRSFDHYFGTMAGTRNFADPNVKVNPDGHSTFEQLVAESQSTPADVLKPWYINYLGGEWDDATQCMTAGDNSWQANHAAWNGGLNNMWVEKNTPFSNGYFVRKEIPVHWDIAEGWTVQDMNTESILAATDPNRIHWMSGTVNVPGTPTNPDGEGGMILDNNATPGCEAPGFNCYPFTWKTFPEYLEEAGISWQVFQDFDNFEDNMLAYFVQYQNAPNGTALREKGNSYLGLNSFYEKARNGTLPQVSWIVGPAELSEHPPYMPSDGAWLQKQVVEAVTSGAAYNETALFITYDEIGGWGDHVAPIVAPSGTAGEWIDDPYKQSGYTPVGPGFRIPGYIVSPWTRGGKVFTEHSDHSSHIRFVEQWAAAQGYSGVKSAELTPWRRSHISDLINAFDFENPDYSIPHISNVDAPLMEPDTPDAYSGNFTLGSLSGPYIGTAKCISDHTTARPPVPYGEENMKQDLTRLPEQGFKEVRGLLTEGRFLTMEMSGLALTNHDGTTVIATPATAGHESMSQRWIVYVQGIESESETFIIQSAADKKYLSAKNLGTLTAEMADAQNFTISYQAAGSSYSIAIGSHPAFVSLVPSAHSDSTGNVKFGGCAKDRFKLFAVSYSN